jgi:hypothetical protein
MVAVVETLDSVRNGTSGDNAFLAESFNLFPGITGFQQDFFRMLVDTSIGPWPG